MSGCFHCGEPVPAGSDFTLVVEGEPRRLCCPGCLAVASLIDRQGLARFYDFRSVPSVRPTAPGRAAA
jgi:Cu2+-exporting ATPase